MLAVTGSSELSPLDVAQFQRFSRHLLQGVSRGLQDTDSGGGPMVQEFETKVVTQPQERKIVRQPKMDDEHSRDLPLQSLAPRVPDLPPRLLHGERFSTMAVENDVGPMQEMMDFEPKRVAAPADSDMPRYEDAVDVAAPLGAPRLLPEPDQDPYIMVQSESPRNIDRIDLGVPPPVEMDGYQTSLLPHEDEDDVGGGEDPYNHATMMPAAVVHPPTVQGEKLVIALRHGRSLAQDAPSARLWSPELADCGLSNAGWRQAEQLRATLAEDDLDLVVCAPLTKALQTALAAFKDLSCPIIVHPALAGDRGGPPEATPRTVAELTEDEGLTSLPRFRALDFSLLGAGWPEERPAAGVQAFLPWMRDRPESRVAVVGIFGVLRRLLPEVVDFPNCKPLRCVLNDDKLTRVSP
jgi:broad specificity phosphatase PhoE